MTLIERNRNILHGAPAIRGTRVFAAQVVEALREGESYDAIRRDYPTLPELTDAEIQHLMSWPLPKWEKQAARGAYSIGLSRLDGMPIIDDGCDSFEIEARHIKAVCDVLHEATQAYQDWHQAALAHEHAAPATAPTGARTEAE